MLWPRTNNISARLHRRYETFSKSNYQKSFADIELAQHLSIILCISGIWDLHHDTIGQIVRSCAKMIQSFLKDNIGLHHVDTSVDIPLTLDTVNFTLNEIRTDPSSKWYDHKSDSCGLVSFNCVCKV